MDPQQRLLLELAWEAMEHAGIPPVTLRGTACGVYLGISTTDYAFRLGDDLAAIDAFTATGNAISIAANRISYLFDLHGPSMAIDTACSSSLVAFHQACQAIASGEAGAALAGGICLHLHPYGFLTFAKASMLSPRGCCSVFDEAADGYVRSEGGGLFLLKELEQALADGDRILAVVAATAVNTDGRRKTGLTVPSARAQAELIEAACRKAGLAPHEIDYFEAHGTGTPVGDPVEAEALGMALGRHRPKGRPLPVGSVKSNLGHLEAAAGVAGLVKALLILQHRLVPATAGIAAPNPAIDFAGLNLRVVQDNLPLRQQGPVYIGVNSFGFGGANAHVILTNHTEEISAEAARVQQELPLVVTARDPDALRAAAGDMAALLENSTAEQMYDLAWNSWFRRELHHHRIVHFGDSPERLAADLRDWCQGRQVAALGEGTVPDRCGGPVFVYGGNGAQWEGMGKGLLQDRVFREAVEELDRHFLPSAGFSLHDELTGKNGSGRYVLTEFAQPALFAIQVGITRMMRSLGVEPVAVIGHSVGEVAAAWACGALSLAAAVQVICHRSRLQGRTKGAGGMTAAGFGRMQAEEVLGRLALPSLVLAGSNSPKGVTFAGTRSDLELLENELASLGVPCRRLDLDYAFHSSAMDPIRQDLLQALAGLAPVASDIPFISTVTGGLLDGQELNADYWWRNVREPVRFEQGVAFLLDQGFNLCISITPHPVLRGYLMDSMQAQNITGTVITTVKRECDSPQLVIQAAATAFASGVEPCRSTLFPQPGRHLTLPAYPWKRERFWHQVTTESLGLLGRRFVHPLLGYRLRQQEHAWEQQIDSGRLPFLADHVVGGSVVYPAAGFLETALAAAGSVKPEQPVIEIERLEIRAPLLLDQGSCRLVRVELDPASGQLLIKGRELLSDAPRTIHATARVVPDPWAGGLVCRSLTVPERSPDFDADSHARLTRQAGLHYGPCFQAITHGWVEGNRAVAQLRLPEVLQSDLRSCHLHPVLLDNALQLVFQIAGSELSRHAGFCYLPVAMERIRYLKSGAAPAFAAAELTGTSPHSLTANLALYDSGRAPVATVQQVRLRLVRLSRQDRDAVRLCTYRLIAGPLAGQPPAGVVRLIEPLLGAVPSLVGRTSADPGINRFVSELEPLLEHLCCRFVAEALQSLSAADGGSGRLPVSGHADGLLKRAADSGVLKMTADGPVVIDEPDALPAALLWRELLNRYPERLALFVHVGRCALNLARRIGGDTVPAPALPLQHLLVREALGVEGRRHVGRFLQDWAADLKQRLSPGERLGLLELSQADALWLGSFRAAADSLDADCHFASCAEQSRHDVALRFGEMQETVVLHDLDDLSLEPGLKIHAAVLTAGFTDQQSAEQAVAAAARALRSGGGLVVIGVHPIGWADLLGEGSQVWQPSAAWWRLLLEQHGFSFEGCTDLASVSSSGPWLLLAEKREDGLEVTHRMPQPGTLLLTGTSPVLESSAAGRVAELMAQRQIRVVSVPVENDAAAVEAELQLQSAQGTLLGVLFMTGLEAVSMTEAYVDHVATACFAASAVAAAAERLQVKVPLCLVACGCAADADAPSMAPGKLADIADAPFWAFGRTMMNEFPGIDLRLAGLYGGPSASQMASLHALLMLADGEKESVLTVDGARFLPRLVSHVPEQVCHRTGIDGERLMLRLEFSLPGQLRNLRWATCPRPSLQAGRVEVAVRATGLNFRDIMYTLGMLSDEAVENGFAGASLGLEYSGVVTAVGEQVTGFRPGDRVVGFGPAGFATRAVTSASALAPVPAGLSFEAAATIPVAFFTAWYALCHQGRLRQGEKVLIHGAAGGVGLAAIQIARHCGADLFATAGTEEKRDFLRLLGVGHVYDSRTLDFADQIMFDTGGSGVDLVLNSLAGEAINRNLRVLKPFGRFIELGKRDFYENTRIGLRPFRNNISYFGVDADQVMLLQPELTRELFSHIISLFERGELQPLPYTVFEAGQVHEAFRYMQQSHQIGKVVVTSGDAVSRFHDPACMDLSLHLPADRTWLVTGGLGGFGLSTAQWLVDKGVRNLVLISRSGPATGEAQSAISALEQRGVTVHAAACDVTDREALSLLLSVVARDLPPLQGIVHAAAVIDDGLLRGMTADQMRRVLAPKLLGALHLHQLTDGLDLEYFVLFSSATTLFGNPGQGNYVAANSWLEALGRLRRASGKPATVVGWGPIDDAGYLARHAQVREALVGRMGGAAMHAAAALALLEQMLLHDLSGYGVLELHWSALRRFLPSAGHGRFSLLETGHGTEPGLEAQVDIRQLARELPEAELAELVSGILRQETGRILRMQPEKIALDRSLYEMGLDSLMGVELATALEDRFGVSFPVMALSETPTVRALALRMSSLLREGAETIEANEQRALIEDAVRIHADDLPAENREALVEGLAADSAVSARADD